MNIIQDIPFPHNVFTEIGIGSAELPKDAEATLYYLLYSEFRQKEADIMLMRYRDNIPLKEIGDSYLLSPARVHSITTTIISKMKSQRNMNLLCKGIMKYIAEEREKSYQLGMGDYQKAFRKGQEQLRTYEDKYNDSIEEMHLMPRTYNALLDNEINFNGIRMIAKVGDIISIGSKGLLQVKGIGMKGFDEIVEVLTTKYGEDPRKWRWRRYRD